MGRELREVAGEARDIVERAVAEPAYDHNDYRKALKYYDLALPRYQGAALPRLLQKKAWAHYRLKQYDQAVSTMKRAIAESGKDDKFLSLRDESLRDMAVFMTESGKVDDALAYFKQVGGGTDFYAKTLERLGAQYERNAETAKAVMAELRRTWPAGKPKPLISSFALDALRGAHAEAPEFPRGLLIGGRPIDWLAQARGVAAATINSDNDHATRPWMAELKQAG